MRWEGTRIGEREGERREGGRWRGREGMEEKGVSRPVTEVFPTTWSTGPSLVVMDTSEEITFNTIFVA